MINKFTINKVSMEEQIRYVEKWRFNIEDIEKQTEELCKVALANTFWSYHYIKKQYRTETIENFCLALLFNESYKIVTIFLELHEFKYNSSLKLIEMYKLLK